MARKWSQVSPAARQRHYLRNSARFRALSRLKLRHPEEFEQLLAEELEEGPIYLADRRTLVTRTPVDNERRPANGEPLPPARLDGEGLAA